MAPMLSTTALLVLLCGAEGPPAEHRASVQRHGLMRSEVRDGQQTEAAVHAADRADARAHSENDALAFAFAQDLASEGGGGAASQEQAEEPNCGPCLHNDKKVGCVFVSKWEACVTPDKTHYCVNAKGKFPIRDCGEKNQTAGAPKLKTAKAQQFQFGDGVEVLRAGGLSGYSGIVSGFDRNGHAKVRLDDCEVQFQDHELKLVRTNPCAYCLPPIHHKFCVYDKAHRACATEDGKFFCEDLRGRWNVPSCEPASGANSEPDLSWMAGGGQQPSAKGPAGPLSPGAAASGSPMGGGAGPSLPGSGYGPPVSKGPAPWQPYGYPPQAQQGPGVSPYPPGSGLSPGFDGAPPGYGSPTAGYGNPTAGYGNPAAGYGAPPGYGGAPNGGVVYIPPGYGGAPGSGSGSGAKPGYGYGTSPSYGSNPSYSMAPGYSMTPGYGAGGYGAGGSGAGGYGYGYGGAGYGYGGGAGGGYNGAAGGGGYYGGVVVGGGGGDPAYIGGVAGAPGYGYGSAAASCAFCEHPNHTGTCAMSTKLQACAVEIHQDGEAWKPVIEVVRCMDPSTGEFAQMACRKKEESSSSTPMSINVSSSVSSSSAESSVPVGVWYALGALILILLLLVLIWCCMPSSKPPPADAKASPPPPEAAGAPAPAPAPAEAAPAAAGEGDGDGWD